MKPYQLFLIFLLLLIAFQSCFSQEKPKTVLVDEFGKAGCEDLSARIDALFVELMHDPNSKGYIVIYGDRNNPLGKYNREELLGKLIKFRSFVKGRIEFLHGKDEENIRTQFWKVSGDADKPTFNAANWDYGLPQNMKPEMVHADSWISEVCPEVFDLQIYSQFVSANPELRGHLVIYDKSLREFRKTEKDLINRLVKQYKVPRNQLKFFFVKRRNPDVEYWLVPKKK